MNDLLIARFERYFRHPDRKKNVLGRRDQAVACVNVRWAIELLDIDLTRDDAGTNLFDENLEAAVKEFQKRYHHRVVDGRVGPETRKLSVSTLLGRYSPNIFERAKRTETERRPLVFLSYASPDAPKVNKLDQWLRDKGIRVIRDESSFQAGTTIPDRIRRAVAEADKVIAIFSGHSRNRDWPSVERAIAEEVEVRIGVPILIYVCLDDTPLPKHDDKRIAIRAKKEPLIVVGGKILHALTGSGLSLKRYEYDENQPL
jgi:hypothetical protein